MQGLAFWETSKCIFTPKENVFFHLGNKTEDFIWHVSHYSDNVYRSNLLGQQYITFAETFLKPVF